MPETLYEFLLRVVKVVTYSQNKFKLFAVSFPFKVNKLRDKIRESLMPLY